MKNININTILALLFAALLWSCEEKSNLDPVGEWELSEPSAKAINDSNKIVLEEINLIKKISFNWEAAVSTENFNVYYKVSIDSVDGKDSSKPIISFNSLNAGRSLTANTTVGELNHALYLAGFKAGTDVKVKCTITALCLSKSTSDSFEFTVNRYDDDKLYIFGEATEAGNIASNGILMRRIANTEGKLTHQYEVYTQLSAQKPFKAYIDRNENAINYGLGEDGKLLKDGNPLTVDEDGIYRLRINTETLDVELLKINSLGVIGVPFTNGWDADEALEYRGNGVWKADISFVNAGNFIVRANNDWVGIIKHVSGSADSVLPEDIASSNEIAVEDFTHDETGLNTVTLTLTGNEYSLKIEKAPDLKIYLLVNGTSSYEMQQTAAGVFTSKFIALQSTDNVVINTKSDGSGTSYTISEAFNGASGDQASESVGTIQGDNTFNVSVDQAYSFNFNLNSNNLTYTYYNFKLFHWDDDVTDGWDARTEIAMTYVHPYTFTVTTQLNANYESKFFSPWVVEFGADDETAMSGTMTHKGGSNFKNISADDTYSVNITVSDDYSTGTYQFTK